MAARCDLCGKGTAVGQNIRHKSTGRWQRKAHRTKRLFKPNLQERDIWRDGKKVSMTLCTRCMRTGLKVAGAPISRPVSGSAPRPS